MSDEETGPLATGETIRDIAANAHDLLIDLLQASMDDEAPIHQRQPLAIAAMRFCALAAAESGDTSLLEILSNGLSMCAEWDDDYGETSVEAIRASVVSLLSRGVRADEQVRSMAEDDSAEVRLAVAEGLKPAGQAEIALLRGLTKDGDANVRNAARKSLQGVADVPWWTGKFSQDPAARMSAREAQRADPIVKEVAQLMDVQGYAQKDALPKIAALVEQLPDGVAADAAENALRLAASGGADDAIAALTRVVLRPRGGEAALARILVRWAGTTEAHWLTTGMGKGVAGLPAARRASICRKLTAGELAGETLAQAETAGRVAATAWPPNADLAPVFDRIEALVEEHADDPDDAWTRVVLSFNSVFNIANAQKGKTLAREVDALFAAAAAPWCWMEAWIGSHLAKLPPAARSAIGRERSRGHGALGARAARGPARRRDAAGRAAPRVLLGPPAPPRRRRLADVEPESAAHASRRAARRPPRRRHRRAGDGGDPLLLPRPRPVGVRADRP
jgi:hypothetical protein